MSNARVGHFRKVGGVELDWRKGRMMLLKAVLLFLQYLRNRSQKPKQKSVLVVVVIINN